MFLFILEVEETNVIMVKLKNSLTRIEPKNKRSSKHLSIHQKAFRSKRKLNPDEIDNVIELNKHIEPDATIITKETPYESFLEGLEDDNFMSVDDSLEES